MKQLLYPLEALLILILVSISRIIGIDRASNLGAFLARKIGLSKKRMGISVKNIQLAFPNITKEEAEKIATKTWENFVRTCFEFPLIYKLSKEDFEKRVEVIGLENFQKLKSDKAIIGVTGHFGNWEILVRTLNINAVIYKKLSNPLANKIMESFRDKRVIQIPKGIASMRDILKSINEKHFIGFLSDQRLDEGVVADLFGKPASTITTQFKLAARSRLPILFARCIRTNGANFKIYIEEPLYLEKTTFTKENELELALKLNKTYERWIYDTPEQWLWSHRRWEKEFYN